MKFTKLIAASFVALAMFSCSKEVTNVDNGQVLNPGDARIVLNLSKGGQTTYATNGEEKDIKKLAYALYDKLGDKISATDNAPLDLGVVDLIISASEYAKLGTDTEVTLCILANGSIDNADNMPATLDLVNAIEIKSSIKDAGVKATGLVASRKEKIDLAKAVNNVLNIGTDASKSKLTRGVARFWVKSSASRSDIQQAVITIKDINEGVAPFSTPNVNTGVVGTIYTDSYTVPATKPENQYIPSGSTEEQEAAFYAYPTESGVSITVKLAGGDEMTIPVRSKIEANQNYSITITTKVLSGNRVVDKIEVEEWTLGGGDFGIDFNAKYFKVANPGFQNADFLIEATGGVDAVYITNNPTPAFSYTIDELYTDAAGVVVESIVDEDILTYAPITTKASKDGLIKVSVSGDGKISIERKFNYHQTANYTLKFMGSDGKVYAMSLVLEGAEYHKNATTNINGLEIMNVGFSADWQTVIEDMSASLGDSFADKMISYISNHTATEVDKIRGTKNLGSNYKNGTVKCPVGFVIPTEAQFKSAFFGASWPSGAADNTLTDIFKFADNVPAEFANSTWTKVAGSVDYWLIESAGTKLIIPGGTSNFWTSTLGVSSGNRRMVIWQDQFERRDNNGSTTDSYLRCVKIADTRF